MDRKQATRIGAVFSKEHAVARVLVGLMELVENETQEVAMMALERAVGYLRRDIESAEKVVPNE